MSIDYTGLPESLRAGARNWIEHGIQPGGFLSAVICNDYMEAVTRADERNLAQIRDIAWWWYNEAPAPCWGSLIKTTKWAYQHKREFHW